MACAVGSEEYQGEHVKEGLVSNHAYSLIGAYEINTQEGPTRLVAVRNPWGSYEWNGAWGDNDERWTPELRAQVNSTGSEDGIFYMTVEDYRNEFQTSTVCKFHEGF